MQHNRRKARPATAATALAAVITVILTAGCGGQHVTGTVTGKDRDTTKVCTTPRGGKSPARCVTQFAHYELEVTDRDGHEHELVVSAKDYDKYEIGDHYGE